MTEAIFKKTDKEIEMTVIGHAGQNEVGYDIVCAAVSMLTYTVAQCVRDLSLDGKMMFPPLITLDAGSACVKCSPKKRPYKDALRVFEFAQRGLELLAANYPDFVRVKTFEEDESPSQ